MKENFTAIAVVLDASGSMSGLTQDTIGSVNSFVAEQKLVPGEAAFSLCTFNTSYHPVHDFISLSSVPELTNKVYRATGGTALLDAMGTTIDNLGTKLAAMPEEDRPSKVIVLVITDGEENSSHTFTLEAIKEKVTHQREVYSWEFVFMGANIDAISAGASLGFTASNSMQYQATAEGTRDLYSTVSASMTSYRIGSSSQAEFFQPAVPAIPVTPAPVVDNTPAKPFDVGNPFPVSGLK